MLHLIGSVNTSSSVTHIPFANHGSKRHTSITICKCICGRRLSYHDMDLFASREVIIDHSSLNVVSLKLGDACCASNTKHTLSSQQLKSVAIKATFKYAWNVECFLPLLVHECILVKVAQLPDILGFGAPSLFILHCSQLSSLRPTSDLFALVISSVNCQLYLWHSSNPRDAGLVKCLGISLDGLL